MSLWCYGKAGRQSGMQKEGLVWWGILWWFCHCKGWKCRHSWRHSLLNQTNTNKQMHARMHGVSWLVDITARGDFLGPCDQKSSYKHVSDFGWLRSYGHFLMPVHALVWTASYRTSWWMMYSTWWLIVCVASVIFATWLTHSATDSPVSVSRHLGGI